MEIEEFFTLLIIHTLFSSIFALIGAKREIGYGKTFALCFFFSAIIGGIFALDSPKKESNFIEIKKEDKTADKDTRQ